MRILLSASRSFVVVVCFLVVVVVFLLFFFSYSFVPCGKFGSPYLGNKAQQPQKQRYPFCPSPPKSEFQNDP